MSSSMVVVDIFLSEPEEMLEDEEDLRKLPSSPSVCTTSLAAAVHFSLDFFLFNFLGEGVSDPEEVFSVVVEAEIEAE